MAGHLLSAKRFMSDLIQDVAVPQVQPPPWLADDVFPPKPPGDDYGYHTGRKLQPCTREQLSARLSDEDHSTPILVWTPETPRLVTPAEVPWLFKDLRL